ncbi:MAG: metal ABC transporter substrate-binding protein [Gemmatimonadales bacterium]
MSPTLLFLLLASAPTPPPRAAAAELRVVTSLSTYAAIARELVGDRGTVVSIGQGNENPHYVQPRPSYALELRRADLFVSTGLDLELWVPALLDKANNPKVSDGGPGHVTAYTGVHLMDVPTSVSRAGGDIHAFGNPHIWADPINAIVIGRNIVTGLKRVSPGDAAYFDRQFAAWRGRVLEAMVGPELVAILGADVVYNLLDQDKFWSFVNGQQYQGAALETRLGGWLKTAAAFRGKAMVCYHKEWDYFSRRFDLPCIAFVEPKPGIPPTPGHVAELIALIRKDRIPVILSANFYDQGQTKSIAARTNTAAVIVPANAGGEPGTDTYVTLVDYWVKALAAAFTRGA